ncbi:MAG TPA: FAD-linked oxidase C-terminal domain-containing protein [Mycobacteriales bacterium]|nr:FAD-linked oxidase C-terminal domain-containing protein [Mycobacteriales bacterium]
MRAVERLASLMEVVTDPVKCATYDCDGLTNLRCTPAAVALPTTAEQVRAAVRICAEEGVPFVARGAGTSLSGGALPRADGVLIVLARLRRILAVDLDDQRAEVEPGVANLDITRAVAGDGWFYAPDPSSQQVCSIGGNVAENAGGAHCLKYGFTANHVTGLDVVLPDGSVATLGGRAVEHPGYDLVGAFVGSEGTLGVATRVTVRLVRAPETVRTLLAGFPTIEAAGAVTSELIAAGIVPAAIEMMDALAMEAATKAAGVSYPPGARAALVVELDGPAAEVAEQFARVDAICAAYGAVEVRVARDEAERALLWRGRKSAFAAVGRISPDYFVQDGVIPRTALPTVLAAMAARAGLRVANVFHAGDGNLHPLVLFDASVPGQAERAEALAAEILDACLDAGGSITGEHGVGAEKVAHLAHQFTADDLDTMQMLRCAFDPAGICNPGKVFPTPRLCGEVPGPRRGAHPLQQAGAAEIF